MADGRSMGLQGMINDVLERCDFPTVEPPLEASHLEGLQESRLAREERVVRPALSWRWDGGRWLEGKAALVTGDAELRARVEGDPALTHPFLVQRRIHGPGCGLFLCADEGRLQAVFSHERMREKNREILGDTREREEADAFIDERISGERFTGSCHIGVLR